MEKYGFHVIDGDCVMQVVKHKFKLDKIEFNAAAMYEEIAKELDILIGFKKDAPVITIWDENKWGKSSEGKVNFVFSCDDLDKTYMELKEKGVVLEPPTTAVWGGKELTFFDLDGNKILLL
jgi:predicted enzyme related to lactoylglutathione lyase